MSEKRFTVMKKFDGSYVICDKVEMLVADDCCDLLNELDDERMMYKTTIDKRIVELKEENEQLKQILKDIVEITDETYTKNASVFKVTVVLDFEKYMEIRRCIE